MSLSENLSNAFTTIGTTIKNLTARVSVLELNSGGASGIPATGARGSLAGYSTPEKVTVDNTNSPLAVTVDDSFYDNYVASTDASVTAISRGFQFSIPDGASGACWVKTISVINLYANLYPTITFTLGDNWDWQDGVDFTFDSAGMRNFVLFWNGTKGVVSCSAVINDETGVVSDHAGGGGYI